MGCCASLKFGDYFGCSELLGEPVERKANDGAAGGVDARFGRAGCCTDRLEVGVGGVVEVDRHFREVGACGSR